MIKQQLPKVFVQQKKRTNVEKMKKFLGSLQLDAFRDEINAFYRFLRLGFHKTI